MASTTAPKKKKSLPRRILKWTGITFLLLLITAIILPFIFKDKIIQFAKDEINKNVNAKVSFGDFDLSFISTFPDFRLTIKDVKVIGVNEFAKDTLANLPELKLNLDLMSVISGSQYKINSIYLDKPRISVRVLADGKPNYDIAKPSAPTKDAAPSQPTKFKMSLKKLQIDNGYIVYDDASLGFKSVLDDMTYTLSGDFTQDDFLMKNTMAVERMTVAYGGMTYLSKVKTDMNADLDMDMVKWKFTFKENEFKLNELAFGLDGFFAMPTDDYDMDLKFKAKQSEFKNFLSLIPGAYTKDFANVKTAGKLSFDGFLKGTYSEKQNKMPGYGLTFQISDAMFQYPSVPKSASAINIDCKIDDASGVPDETKIDVNKFHVDFGGNPIDATLHVSTPVSDANINGALKCSLDLATLKDVMPIEKGDELDGKVKADVKMNGRMSQIEKSQYDQFQCSGNVGVTNMNYKTSSVGYDMNIAAMNMDFTPQFISLTKFDAKLGKNDVHADGRIDDLMTYLFKDSLLRGTFNMNSSLMDLNQFMGDETATATPAPVDTAAMTIMEVPGNIDFTLKSSITKLIYQDINMDNVSGVVALRNKTIDISNLAMNLLGGKMNLNGNYSTVNPMVPKVNFKIDITDFDIQQSFKTFPTVAKMVPIAQYSKGRYSTKLNYTSDLDHAMMPVITSVNGQGTLSTKQVEVEGFGPLKKLDDELKLNKFKKVTLQDLNLVSFKIENGRVSTEPFDFKIGKSAGQVGGSTGIDQSINYVMNVAIPRDEFGPANTALNSMVSSATAKGIPVKLGDVVNVQALFGGTVTNPTVKTNLKEAGANLADELKNTIKDTAKALINNAVNNATDQACKDAQTKLDQAKAAAVVAQGQAHKAADDAKAAAYKQADDLEKKGGNPIEKGKNKLAAAAIRKTADDTHDKSIAKADQVEKDAENNAQHEHDKTCPPK
jgi:hypothetical protein